MDCIARVVYKKKYGPFLEDKEERSVGNATRENEGLTTTSTLTNETQGIRDYIVFGYFSRLCWGSSWIGDKDEGLGKDTGVTFDDTGLCGGRICGWSKAVGNLSRNCNQERWWLRS